MKTTKSRDGTLRLAKCSGDCSRSRCVCGARAEEQL